MVKELSLNCSFPGNNAAVVHTGVSFVLMGIILTAYRDASSVPINTGLTVPEPVE